MNNIALVISDNIPSSVKMGIKMDNIRREHRLPSKYSNSNSITADTSTVYLTAFGRSNKISNKELPSITTNESYKDTFNFLDKDIRFNGVTWNRGLEIKINPGNINMLLLNSIIREYSDSVTYLNGKKTINKINLGNPLKKENFINNNRLIFEDSEICMAEVKEPDLLTKSLFNNVKKGNVFLIFKENSESFLRIIMEDFFDFTMLKILFNKVAMEGYWICSLYGYIKRLGYEFDASICGNGFTFNVNKDEVSKGIVSIDEFRYIIPNRVEDGHEF